MVAFLLKRKAPVNELSGGSGAALHLAAREGRLDLVKLLIDKGADTNLPARQSRRGSERTNSAGHGDLPRADQDP